jgi:hypothetical protein
LHTQTLYGGGKMCETILNLSSRYFHKKIDSDDFSFLLWRCQGSSLSISHFSTGSIAMLLDSGSFEALRNPRNFNCTSPTLLNIARGSILKRDVQ